MENSGLKGPRIKIFFDCIERFCFNNPGAKKCPERAIVFHFFGYVMCILFFLFLFGLNLSQQTMEIDGIPSPNRPKEVSLYKTKDPGPACIDMPFEQPHYKIRDQVPQY